jgi:cytidine deaminase
MTLEELKQTALQMRAQSYCPYSHFAVGAALECADGSVFTGCNVENASYPVGLCAERTAAAKAVSEGHRDFRRIVLAGSSGEFCYPCGMCRQFLAEFAPELEVVCLNDQGLSRTLSLQDLLPCSFSGEALGT